MSKTLWKKQIINGTPCLVPDCRDAEEWLRKTSLHKGVMIDPRRPRNIQHHRKLFALLNLAVDNWPMEIVPTTDGLLDTIKVATGHTIPVEVRPRLLESICPEIADVLNAAEMPERVTVFFPKSISFESLSQDEFEPFYERAVAIIAKLLGVDISTLEQEAV